MNNILSFLSNFFTDIANAIRQKDSDITEEMTISQMVTNINNIHPHIEIVQPSQMQKTYDPSRDPSASSSLPNVIRCRNVSNQLVNNIDNAYCIISLHGSGNIPANPSDTTKEYIMAFFPIEKRKGRIYSFNNNSGINGYYKRYIPEEGSTSEEKQFIINGHPADPESPGNMGNTVTVKLPKDYYFARGQDYYITFIYNG